MHLRALFALLLSTATLAVAPSARAESSPEDRAAADALYEESATLIKAGRFKEAVEKLEASQKLDPGIGTTLRLAYCYEKIGRTASAWAAFNDAESMARKAGDKRADEAAKQAKRIEPSLSRLRLDVAAESQAAGVEIKRDGRVIAAAAWTSAVPIDPGEHVLEASASGRQPWKTTITIEAKPGVTAVQVPALTALPEVRREPSAEAPRPFWSGQRIAGASVAGVGLGGVIAGAVLGGLAISKNNASKDRCLPADPRMCDADGVDLRLSAGRFADASTGALIAGGVVAAAGLAVFLTVPTSAAKAKQTGGTLTIEAAPFAGASTAGLSLRGAW